MKSRTVRDIALMCAGALLLLAAGCAKKTPAPPPATPPPPPAAPARPTVTLSASPTFVRSGDTVTLNWSTTNATDVEIAPSVGKVAPEGSTTVTPTESTTYTATATGPGGTDTATVRVTVSPAAPPAPPAASPSMEELFRANVFDAFFDFNKSDIRPDAREALSKTSQFLRSYPNVKVVVEGHCDERGSEEYNLGLGQRRATAVKDFLVSLGVEASRIDTVSYGKERPFCTEHNEACWQQNRRGHFVMAK
jgi:peptidoglycan-associated lipoprotein